MRLTPALVSLVLFATAGQAAPVYIDQLMETPLATLQTQFSGLRKEGCYRLVDGRHLMISMNMKERKPWRVALATDAPCRKPQAGPEMDVQHRSGVLLGDKMLSVVEKLGRPDTSTEPEAAMERLGENEYFYMCRVSEGCARHTSIFIRDGAVSAISDWYSD